MTRSPKPHTITVRLTDKERDLLDRAQAGHPYKLPVTAIVARGIELAAQELEAFAERAKGGSE